MRYLNPILILLPTLLFCSSDFAGSSNPRLWHRSSDSIWGKVWAALPK